MGNVMTDGCKDVFLGDMFAKPIREFGCWIAKRRVDRPFPSAGRSRVEQGPIRFDSTLVFANSYTLYDYAICEAAKYAACSALIYTGCKSEAELAELLGRVPGLGKMTMMPALVKGKGRVLGYDPLASCSTVGSAIGRLTAFDTLGLNTKNYLAYLFQVFLVSGVPLGVPLMCRLLLDGRRDPAGVIQLIGTEISSDSPAALLVENIVHGREEVPPGVIRFLEALLEELSVVAPACLPEQLVQLGGVVYFDTRSRGARLLARAMMEDLMAAPVPGDPPVWVSDQIDGLQFPVEQLAGGAIGSLKMLLITECPESFLSEAEARLLLASYPRVIWHRCRSPFAIKLFDAKSAPVAGVGATPDSTKSAAAIDDVQRIVYQGNVFRLERVPDWMVPDCSVRISRR